jgi:hypothetical protein
MFWRKGRDGDVLLISTPLGDVIKIAIGQESRGEHSDKPRLRVGVDAPPGYMISASRKPQGRSPDGPV